MSDFFGLLHPSFCILTVFVNNFVNGCNISSPHYQQMSNFISNSSCDLKPISFCFPIQVCDTFIYSSFLKFKCQIYNLFFIRLSCTPKLYRRITCIEIENYTSRLLILKHRKTLKYRTNAFSILLQTSSLSFWGHFIVP